MARRAVSSLLCCVGVDAAERALETLAAEGTLAARVPDMMTRARLYELVDYEAYADFDATVYTFDLKNNLG